MNTIELKKTAWRMRCRALKMALAAGANGAHLGPGLSMMEIAVVLFKNIIHMSPAMLKDPDRDRFILSKAHAVLAYYTGLAECEVVSDADLDTFEKNGTFLTGHPIASEITGVEVPGGSLGMGLPFGVGCALAGKLGKKPFRTFVILGDGECDEGSVWEAAMSAANYKLSNLCVIVDRNHLQYDGNTEEVMSLENLADKWRAFGWETACVNGHDVDELQAALRSPLSVEKPTAVIADTIKGKGVSFMENNREWHHSRLTQVQYDQAMLELMAAGKELE